VYRRALEAGQGDRYRGLAGRDLGTLLEAGGAMARLHARARALSLARRAAALDPTEHRAPTPSVHSAFAPPNVGSPPARVA
jgi:hypothetical protein